MITPKKTTQRVLNSSYTPFSTMASSKVSNESPNKSAGSTSQKKFSRKRQDSNDSNKNLARFEKMKKSLALSKQEQPQQYEQKQSLIRTQQPSKKIQRKGSKFQQEQYLRLRTDRSKYDYVPVKLQVNTLEFNHLRNKTQTSQMTDYRIELQIKNQELIILQDENNRLKLSIKEKQLQTKKTIEQIKDAYDLEIKGLKRRIQNLIKSMSQKEKEFNQMKMKENEIVQQMSVILKQNNFLKSQLDLYMKKLIPKNFLQIQSFRQVSLNNQIKELKKQINMQKTERDKNTENEVSELRQVCSIRDHECKSLQIANRVLKRKASSVEVSAQNKAKSQINQIKEKMKQKIKQISILKKQNVRLQKIAFENNKSKSLLRTGRKHNLQTQSQDSISFSLSR